MLKLSAEQHASFGKFDVTVSDDIGFMTLSDVLTELGSTKLFALISDDSGAPNKSVAASIFMRRYGFFIAAQLQLYSEYQLVWMGPLEDVQLHVDGGSIKFTVAPGLFKKINTREEALRFVLDYYGHPVVEYVSKLAKISKLILWENIWGYVIWMYTMLIQNHSVNAQQDLDALLNDDLWKPAMRRSPFKVYLQNKNALEAMANYKRTTCCLLKEVPGTDHCPYCPLLKS